MKADTLRAFLAQWIEIEQAGPYGEIRQRERLAAVAELVAKEHAGDFVEIGVLHGSTTVMLAEVARRYGRKVIAIDPFEIGTQNCSGGELEIFLKNVEPYADVVEFLRMRSDDARVREVVWRRALAFAFVDGLHTYLACYDDLFLVKHAAVIAVDDTLWSAEVRSALSDGAGGRAQIVIPEFRESWLV